MESQRYETRNTLLREPAWPGYPTACLSLRKEFVSGGLGGGSRIDSGVHGHRDRRNPRWSQAQTSDPDSAKENDGAGGSVRVGGASFRFQRHRERVCLQKFFHSHVGVAGFPNSHQPEATRDAARD